MIAWAGASHPPAVLPGMAAAETQIVRFADPRWPPVRLLRGLPVGHAAAGTAAVPAPVSARPRFRSTPANTQIVTFGDGRGERVAVVRGPGSLPPVVRPAAMMGLAALRAPAVGILRGGVADSGFGLFGAASGGELDRVAFAVDGVESGHGSNLAMWRADPEGPQGPMQVSLAAALDVGGGDRFDIHENRLIGRAYLASMYRRYGNWPDAIAAYNWGPGNLDQWIAAGRPVERLPLETARYLDRVMRNAFLGVRSSGIGLSGSTPR